MPHIPRFQFLLEASYSPIPVSEILIKSQMRYKLLSHLIDKASRDELS